MKRGSSAGDDKGVVSLVPRHGTVPGGRANERRMVSQRGSHDERMLSYYMSFWMIDRSIDIDGIDIVRILFLLKRADGEVLDCPQLQRAAAVPAVVKGKKARKSTCCKHKTDMARRNSKPTSSIVLREERKKSVRHTKQINKTQLKYDRSCQRDHQTEFSR